MRVARGQAAATPAAVEQTQMSVRGWATTVIARSAALLDAPHLAAERRATRPAEALAGLAQLPHHDRAQLVVALQTRDLVDAGALLLALLDQPQPVQPGQALERHVRNTLRLLVVDRHRPRRAVQLDGELRLELLARVVVVLGAAHDAHDLVDRVQGREQRHQAVQVAQQDVALVHQAPGDHLEAELHEVVERLAQVHEPGHALDQHRHVDADRHAQRGVSHEVGDQAGGVAAALEPDLHPQAGAVREVLRQLRDVLDALRARRLHDLRHDLVGRNAP